jgi:hypothetical protein
MAAIEIEDEIELQEINSTTLWNYARDKSMVIITIDTIVEKLSASNWPTQSESCLIASQLPNSNFVTLMQQADDKLNFWGVLTTPENPYGLLIETSSEAKLVVVFNDSGAVRFAFLEGLFAEFAIRYTRFLPLRNNPFWSTMVFAFGKRRR